MEAIISVPRRHRIKRVLFGHGETWLKVTDRLLAGETPSRVCSLWAGSNPVPFYAKEL